MIFGIKTKKDKRIEELEKEVEYLKVSLGWNRPVINYTRFETQDLKCRYILPALPFDKEERVEIAKYQMTEEFSKGIMPFIEYRLIADELGQDVLVGRLSVVDKRGMTLRGC